MRPPELPAHAALLLDFDGTLVEIARRPDAIRVPPDLAPMLGRLSARFSGAVAIVSGRPLGELDRYLPIAIAKVGEHGAAMRPRPGGPVHRASLPPVPARWRLAATRMAANRRGMIAEQKPHGVVLHYRLWPSAAGEAEMLLASLVAERSDEFRLQPAHMAWEIVPVAVSKGHAVERLMQQPPFRGRAPVFIGDDATDEDAIAAATAMGGTGFRVKDAFATPRGVRSWLATLAEHAAPDGRGA